MFKRPPYIRARSALIGMRSPVRAVMAPSGDAVTAAPKGVTCKPGKRAPTKDEAAWMARISAFGCIACHRDGHPGQPADVHHILSGGRRMGHLFTLPLCPGHHRDGAGAPGLVARHPHKARFELMYGPELFLHELVKHLV